jgi:hypothetical protein
MWEGRGETLGCMAEGWVGEAHGCAHMVAEVEAHVWRCNFRAEVGEQPGDGGRAERCALPC